MKNCLLIFIVFTLISCSNAQNELNSIQGNAIGTTYSIKYIGEKKTSFEAEIDSIIKKVNKSTSTYIPTSDISKINNGDSNVVTDAIFQEVFQKSNKIFKDTNGDFDPTVGILVNAWGFGPGDKIENLDSLKIKELLKYVGFNKVTLKDKKVIKQYPEIYFDFNAIAKGFLVDLVGRLFEQNNIENYMVEIGGEIRARGKNQKGIYWTIAIENPNFDGTRSYATTIQLQNESIATSGNYRKFRSLENGQKYVHTINTKTGFATESNLLSASVISKSDCADVDGYATAFMAMGLEKTKDFLINHNHLKAFLIYSDAHGAIQTLKSDNFEN